MAPPCYSFVQKYKRDTASQTTFIAPTFNTLPQQTEDRGVVDMEFTALHRLLGHGPGPLTDEMIDEAVSQTIAETDDLDWKSSLPPTSGLPQTDFPKDVAAMANSGGGVIVYGVKEQEKRATERVDAGDLTENHERTLRSGAVTAISPPVFGLGIHRLGEPGNQCVVIVVPASVDGPHLIYKNDYFAAPIRNNADTVWMKERQIEAMYRARFDERRHAAEALDNLYGELIAGRDTAERAWLFAVGRPRVTPTTITRWDREDAPRLFNNAAERSLSYARREGIRPFDTASLINPRPGLRRWVAPNTAIEDKARWKEAWASIHFDGSVTVVFAIGGHRSREGFNPGSLIDSAAVEGAVADFLGLVRTVGAHIGPVDYEIRVGIEWTGQDQMIMQTVDNQGYRFAGTSIPMHRFTPVEATIEVGTDDERFLHQVRALILDCVNQGGITNLRITTACPCDECQS